MNSSSMQSIPRILVTDLHAQSHSTDVWELASENLTLSMCRHNVCVLKLPEISSQKVSGAFGCLDSLLSKDATEPTSQPLAMAEDEPGLFFLPGRHSYNFKLGSSKAEHLTNCQSTHLHQVCIFCCLLPYSSSLLTTGQVSSFQNWHPIIAGIWLHGYCGSAGIGSNLPVMPCSLAIRHICWYTRRLSNAEGRCVIINAACSATHQQFPTARSARGQVDPCHVTRWSEKQGLHDCHCSQGHPTGRCSTCLQNAGEAVTCLQILQWASSKQEQLNASDDYA